MAGPYEGITVGIGTRIQAGVPVHEIDHDRRVNGLLLRGVVRATYVSSNPGHPMAGDNANPPKAVYCDVLVYPSLPGQRWFGLTQVLVTQPTGGMHRGRIWKPRATTVNLDAKKLDQTTNPAAMDGDHVLIGFLNDSFDQPIILRGLPHPAMDAGQAAGQNPLGRRMILVDGDHDPDFVKHHGTFRGVDTDGNFIVDSCWANDGKLQDAQGKLGHEADPPTDGKGAQTFKLPQDAQFAIALFDMADPSAPNKVMQLTVDKDKLHLQVAQGETLQVEGTGASAKFTLGNGAVKVAVADHLGTLYGLLKAAYDGHKHPTGTGPSGTPDTPAPGWDPNINSSQVLIPDTIP